MANITNYRPHNFEVAKQNIYRLSSNQSEDTRLSSFETEGWFFGLNDHKVTGAELNSQLVSPLQDKLTGLTNDITNLFSIAHQTYNAMESLDKDYIQGIVAGLNSAKEASDQALNSSRQALNASSEVKRTQDALVRVVDALKQTADEFKNYKQQTNAALNSLRSNIDSIKAAVGGIKNLKQDIASRQSAFEDRMQGVASQSVIHAAPSQPIAAYIIASVALAISVVHLVLNACGIL